MSPVFESRKDRQVNQQIRRSALVSNVSNVYYLCLKGLCQGPTTAFESRLIFTKITIIEERSVAKK